MSTKVGVVKPPPLLPNGLPRRAWRVSEVATMLGVSDDTVYRLLSSGELGWVPANTSKLIPCEELDRYLGDVRHGGAA
jgi:excisionase family DNA binding protein